MTKRFANPSRSRATRGAKTLGFERDLLFRSIDDEGDERRVARSTATLAREILPRDRFARLFSAEFSREKRRGVDSWRRRSRRRRRYWRCGGAGVPRPQRYRSAVWHGSTANRQRPRALPLSLSPSVGCPRSVAAPWMVLAPSLARIVSTTARCKRPPLT